MGLYNVKIKDYNNDNLKRYITYKRAVEFNKTSNNTGVRGEAKNKNKSIYESIRRTKTSIYDYARSNDFEYFITLTFSPDVVDRYNYDAVSKKLTTWLNNIRKRIAPDLKYILVPEQHKDGAYHFHGLLANIGNMKYDYLYTRKKVDYYRIMNYKLGRSDLSIIGSKKATEVYIMKYITKDLVEATENKKRYWVSKNLNTPTVSVEFVNDVEQYTDSLKQISEFEYTHNMIDKSTGECVNSITYLDI